MPADDEKKKRVYKDFGEVVADFGSVDKAMAEVNRQLKQYQNKQKSIPLSWLEKWCKKRKDKLKKEPKLLWGRGGMLCPSNPTFYMYGGTDTMKDLLSAARKKAKEGGK